MPSPPKKPDPTLARLKDALAALVAQHQRDINELFENDVCACATPDVPLREEVLLSDCFTGNASGGDSRFTLTNSDCGGRVDEPAQASSIHASSDEGNASGGDSKFTLTKLDYGGRVGEPAQASSIPASSDEGNASGGDSKFTLTKLDYGGRVGEPAQASSIPASSDEGDTSGGNSKSTLINLGYGGRVDEPAHASSIPASSDVGAPVSVSSIPSPAAIALAERKLNVSSDALEIGEHRRTPLAIAKLKTMPAKKSNWVSGPISGRSLREMMDHSPALTRIVSSKAYELCVMALVVGNAASIGLQLQDSAIHSEQNRVLDTTYYRLVEAIFVVLFSVELALHVCASRTAFFFSIDWRWNVFDTVVVVSMWAEEILAFFSSEAPSGILSHVSVLRIMRLMRIIRILRIIRVLKFFRELRIMMTSILNAIMSLVWAVLLMGIMFYVFGLMLTTGVVDFLGDNAAWEDPRYQTLAKHFGRIDRSMVSLFEAMAGGISWGELLEDLQHLTLIYVATFLAFISVAIFAVMNIVTGVFVQSAMERSNCDRESLIQDTMAQKESYVKKMHVVFQEMDVDNSGTLTFQELERAMEDERMTAYFDALGLDAEDIDTLFVLLDRDGTGNVDVQEFLNGCMKLKGEAKEFDVAVIQYQNKWIMYNMAVLGWASESKRKPGLLSTMQETGTDQDTLSRQGG